MRAAVPAAAVLLVAGCSTTVTSPTAVRGGPPVAGNSVETVIAWIEAAPAANPAGFHTADRDGEVTDLREGIAFRMPRDLPPRTVDGCMTTDYPAPLGSLSCLAGLDDPPPRPAGLPGEWIGNWVDFDGSTIDIGSRHGDPGPFSQGVGRPLPYGQRLKFGDFGCRSDPSGLYCVNYRHRSAVLLGDTLIAWGCLAQPTPPRGIGRQYDCSG